MKCLNLSNPDIKILVDKYGEVFVSKLLTSWEEQGNTTLPTQEYIDNFIKLSTDSNITSTKYTPNVINDFNRLCSNLILRVVSKNGNLDIKKDILDKGIKSFKDLIISNITTIAEKNKSISQENKDLLLSLINDLRTNNDNRWDKFIKYLDYNFGLKIKNGFDDYISEDNIGELQEDWDNNKLFKEFKSTISDKIKIKISGIIDKENLSSFGIPTVININDIFNELIYSHRYDDLIFKQGKENETYNNVINTLRIKGDNINNIYHSIADLLEESINRNDELKYDFIHAYLQAIKPQIQRNEIFTLELLGEHKIKINKDLNNKSSFPIEALRFKIISDIQYAIENSTWDNINFNSISSLNGVNNFIDNLNIPLAQKFINNLENKYKLGKPKDIILYNKLLNKINLINKELKQLYIKKKGKSISSLETEVWNDILDLLNILEPGLKLTPIYSFSNINSKIQQTTQQINFISNLFKYFKEGDNDSVLQKFKIYTEIPSLKTSNWLWKQTNGDNNGIFIPIFDKSGKPKLFGFDRNNNETSVSSEILYYNYKINEQYIDQNNNIGFDLKYLNQFNLALYGGQKNITSKDALEYAESIGYSYDLMCISNYLLENTNATTNYSMLLPASDSGQTYKLDVPKHNINIKLTYDSNKKINNIELDDNTRNKIKNTILSEIEELFVARQFIFNNEWKNGIFNPKFEYKTLDLQKEDDISKINENINITKLHSVKHGKYIEGSFQLTKDNKPLGSVFYPSNLTYVENNTIIGLYDYLQIQGINLHTLENIDEIKEELDNFIYKCINNRINNFYNYIEPLQSTLFNLNLPTKIKNKSKLIFEGENKLIQLKNKLAQFYLDNYLNFVEFGNIIYGNNNEYKDVLDWNKRVNQAIRPGLQHFGNREIKQITVNDIYLSSKIKNLIGEYLSEDIKNQYNAPINIGDGFSFITLEEYKKRLVEAGRLEEYLPIIKQLESGQRLNPNNYNKFIESQKYFSYSRQIQHNIPTLTSYQFKNSSMVLIPSIIRNTQLEDLYNWMNEVGVDQINLDSATKIGGVHKLTIHDENGNFVKPNIEISKQYITKHPISNLYIQQDIPSHIMDSDNTLGVQLMKLIITNLNQSDNAIYTINGIKKTGKELFKLYQDILSSSIKDSALNLMKFLDAVDENGNIKYDLEGNIIVNRNKILELVRDYIETSTDNSNMLSSIEGDLYDTNIPIYASINTTKFVQITLSKFTKEIVTQKLPGMSLTLVPEMFIKPNKDLNSLLDDSNFSFTDEFKKRVIEEGFSLKPAHINKEGKLEGYEAIINPYLANLIDKDGNIDINKLSKDAREMIGIRIPTEGKQSVVFIKVVGFMNSGASQIILPYDLVNTTGWDFDIDKLFVYYKHTEEKNGKLDTINNYSDKDDIDKLDSKTKDNLILEIIKSIMTNEHHFNEIWKQNEMKHIQAISQYVNDKAGFNVKNFNQNDITEVNSLRTLNIQTRNLKGISVATDGLINILSNINAKFDGRFYPQTKVKDTHFKLTQDELKQIFGKEIISEGGFYLITDNYIGNNSKGTWIDVSGLSHSTQLSEVTSNILDAVKKLMFFNFNKITIGVFKTMSMGSILHRDNITKKGNGEFNRYLYPTLFLSQPIITDFINNTNLAITYDAKSRVIYNKIYSKYYNNFLKTIYNTKITGKNIDINKTLENKPKKNKYTSSQIVLEGDNTEINGKELINNIINLIVPDNKRSIIKSILNNTEQLDFGKNSALLIDLYKTLKRVLSLDNNTPTLEDLNKNFLDYYEVDNKTFPTIDKLSNQIEILNIYKKYDELSNAITKLVNTLNVDKKGIGPNITGTKKLYFNINNSNLTIEELKDKLKSIQQNNIEIQKDNILNDEIINNILLEYNSKVTPNQKLDIINDINSLLEPYNEIIKESTNIVKVGKESVIKSILPNSFGLSTESSFKMLDTIVTWGHKTALESISNLSLFETSFAKELKNILFEKFKHLDIDYLDKIINNSLLRSYSNNIPYFENSKIEIPRIFGISSETNTNDINILDDINISENLDKFNKLSLSKKIRLIQSKSLYKDYINNPKFKNAHILKYIVIKDLAEQIKKNGFELIDYINAESDQNMQIYSILDMFYNNNPYIKSIAQDLIKYTFFRNGFKFGNNLAKLIPSELYYYTKEDSLLSDEEKEELRLNTPKEYSNIMRSKLDEANSLMIDSIRQEQINKFIEALHKQELFNSKINPNFRKFIITKLIGNDLGLSNDFDIIVKKQDEIDNSFFYSNIDYGTIHDGNRTRLFKRISETIEIGKEIENIYIYYPINATLPGEFLTTNIDNYKELDEKEYLALIEKLKISNKLQAILNGTYNSNIDLKNSLDILNDNTSDFIKSKLDELDILDEYDDENREVDILTRLGQSKDKFERYVEYLKEYLKEYNDDNISIYTKQSELTEQKQWIFELAKADNKQIKLINTTTKEEKIYNGSEKVSKDMHDIFIEILKKYDLEHTLSIFYPIVQNAIINKQSISEYINNNKDKIHQVVQDNIKELSNTEFFKDLNKELKINNSNLEINYSKNITTISNKTTLTDTIKAIELLSDITIYIGNKNNLEFKTLKNPIHIDYNKPIKENINNILNQLKNKNKITLGILGENDIKSQEFYNEYTNIILNKLARIINKPLRLITLDNIGVSQAVILNNFNFDVLVLDNKNQFDFKHNFNINYTKDITKETLTDTEQKVISNIDRKLRNQKTIELEKQGLNDLVRLPSLLYGTEQESYFKIRANKITNPNLNLIDKLAKEYKYKDAKIGFEYLEQSAIDTKNYIDLQLEKFESIDFNTLFDSENNNLRMKFTSELRILAGLRKSLNYIDNLVEIDSTDIISDDEKKQVDSINNVIRVLKKLKNTDLDLKFDKLNQINTKFWGGYVIANRSKNPNVNSLFNKVKENLQYYINTGIELEKPIITDEDVIHNISNIFSAMDINKIMRIFDSPFNTGITIIDAALLEYFDQQEQMKVNRNNYKDRLNNALIDYFGNKDIALSMSQTNYNKRKNLFNSLIDSNNRFIDVINWSEFEKSYYDNQDEIRILSHKYDSTDNEEQKSRIKQDIINKQYTWLANNIEGITINKDENNDVIEWENTNKLTINELNSLIDNEAAINNNDRFHRYLIVNKIHKLKTKYINTSAENSFIKLIPKKSKYKNIQYDNLSKETKKLIDELKSIIHDINKQNLDIYEFDTNFFPKILEPSFKTQSKELIGVSSITKVESFTKTGINNEIEYYSEAPHIKDFEFYKTFDIPNKIKSETAKEYQERVLRTVNNSFKTAKDEKQEFMKDILGENGFNNIQDIYNYNKAVKKYNRENTTLKTIKDPLTALNTYIDGLTNYKLVNDMYDYNLALIDTLDLNLKLNTAQQRRDYLKDKIKGKASTATINYKDSNVSEQLRDFGKNIHGISLVNTAFQQKINMMYRYTSLTYMAFGWMNGIKNIATGYSNELTEALAGQFVDFNSLAKATKAYMSCIQPLIASIGTDYTDNLDAGLIKDAPEIFEDTSEQAHINKVPGAQRIAKMAYDSAYLMNNIGEHFMQYNMFLAMHESHRVFQGKIFSKYEFLDNNINTILKEYLNEDEIDYLNKFIEKERKNSVYEIEKSTLVSRWLALSDNKNIIETKSKNIIKGIKDLNKKSSKIYDSLPTLKSYFIMENGRVKIKEDSGITQNEYSQFKRKVQLVNQYLHGVYNNIDKNQLKQNIYGSMAMQFRNWIRPNIIRYYGTRLGKATFNEGLGIYQKGAYSTLFQFIMTPYNNRKYTNREGNYIKKSFANIMSDYLQYFKHLKFHYETLSENDKSKVRIAITNFAQVFGLTLVTGLILGFAGDDDEEKARAIQESKGLATILYFTYSVNSELNQMMPQKLATTISKFRQNTMATESVITDIIELLSTAIQYPFLDDNELIYDRGIYKGDSKLKIQFEKVFPLARQMNKTEYIQSYMNWYKQYATKWY